jgi:hypothetical protein
MKSEKTGDRDKGDEPDFKLAGQYRKETDENDVDVLIHILVLSP